jgi:hypothetical protein
VHNRGADLEQIDIAPEILEWGAATTEGLTPAAIEIASAAEAGRLRPDKEGSLLQLQPSSVLSVKPNAAEQFEATSSFQSRRI